MNRPSTRAVKAHMKAKPFEAIAIFEGELGAIRSFYTENARGAWINGVSVGADAYGAGSAGGWCWPEEAEEIKKDYPDVYSEACEKLGVPQ